MAETAPVGWKEKVDGWLFRLTQIGVVWLLVGNVLYPKFPLIPVSGTYVNIRGEDFLIGLVGILWVLAMRLQLLKLWKHPITKAMALFIAVGWLATANAIFITQTVNPLLTILHTVRRFEYLITFFFVYTTVRSIEDAYFYLRVVALTCIGVFAYGYGQKFYALPVISTMNKEYSSGIAQAIMFGGRINSTFAGHYDLAAYTVIMMNVLLGLWAAGKGIWSKIGIWIVIAMTFWLLLSTASRISYVAYMGSIPLTLWFLRKRLWIAPVLAISGIAMFWAPGLVDRYTESIQYEVLPRLASIEWPWEKFGETPTQPVTTPTPTPTQGPIAVVTPGVQPPVGSTQPGIPEVTPTRIPRPVEPGQVVIVPEDRSTAIRFKVEWPRALRAFYKQPLLGTGYSSITLATDNDYLRALGEVGLLGLGSFLLIFLVVLREGLPTILTKNPSPEQKIIIAIAGATLGFLANALFIDVFEASKVAIFYWMILGIGMALITLTARQKQEN